MEGGRDPLTRALNRRFLPAILGREVTFAKENGTALSVMLVDIDHFKAINDRHGHQVGDEVLRQVAQVIVGNVRATDFVFRYGGEEFLIVLVETGIEAAANIPAWFFRDWVGHMRESVDSELFVVAEYWHPDMAALGQYLEQVDRQLMLFDVALHHRFHEASRADGDFDLRTLFDNTLVAAMPDHAVTIVGNHDTQPLQALEAPVEDWFKLHAYALILMREQGTPCLFHPDLYGARYSDTGGDGEVHDIMIAPVDYLPRLVQARQRFAHGAQTDIFDDPHCLMVVRHGTHEQPGAILILTNRDSMEKTVELGSDHADAAFVDYLGHCDEERVADGEGRLTVRVAPGSVSLWVRSDVLA